MSFEAKVLFDYQKVEEGELSLSKDTIVSIEEVNESGWSFATYNGESGWIPSDYVEKVDHSKMEAFRPQPKNQVASFDAKPDVTDLLNQMKVNEGEQKVCQGCKEPIKGAFVVAKEFAYHPSHFQCKTCGVELGGKPYLQHESDLYCEKDYYSQFNPRCYGCQEVIEGSYITAMDQNWHADHFVCYECKQPFTSTFRRHEGQPYCDEHYAQKFADRCATCNEPVLGQIVEALNKKFHVDCFKCEEGHKIEPGHPFHEHEGHVFCPEHYEDKICEKCEMCKKPLKGQFIKVMDKSMHQECWKCPVCQIALNGGNATLDNGSFICKPCLTTKRAVTSPERAAPSKPAVAAPEQPKPAAFSAPKVDAPKVDAPKPEQPSEQKETRSASVVSSFAAPGSVFYSYELLKSKDNRPSDVDPTKKEVYLSDEEFSTIFKMSKEEFGKLAQWKKDQKKKEVSLF